LISGKDISALFGKSLLEKRICSNYGSVTLILWNNMIFPFNRFESISHVIIRSSVHMTCGPLEEALFSNTRSLSMLGIVELVLGFTQEGVIKI
jgi:hypothetical protein